MEASTRTSRGTPTGRTKSIASFFLKIAKNPVQQKIALEQQNILNEAAAYQLSAKVAEVAERNERQAELSRMLAIWKLETRLTASIGCTPNAFLCVV